MLGFILFHIFNHILVFLQYCSNNRFFWSNLGLEAMHDSLVNFLTGQYVLLFI